MGQKLLMPTNIVSMSFDQLKARSRPVDSSAPEANVDVLFDEQTYLAAGVAKLDFFSNVNANSNMDLAGTLPADTFFDVYRIFLDAHRLPTATVADTAAGVLTDLATILHTARGRWTWNMLNKPVGPIPVTFLGSSGSVEGMIGTGRAAAAGAVIQVARMPDNGGWPANGTIRIPPMTKFAINMGFTSTAIGTDTPLAVTLLGIKYRRLG